jgi:hypothetical protein
MIAAPEEPKAKKGKKKVRKQRRKVVEEEFEEEEDEKDSIINKLVCNSISSVTKKLNASRKLKIRKSNAYIEYFKDNLEYLGEEFDDEDIDAADFGICLFYALMNEGKAVAKEEADEELAEDVNFRVALISAVTIAANAGLLDEAVSADKWDMKYPNITLHEDSYSNVKSLLTEVYEKGYSQKSASYILNLLIATKEIEVEELK